MTWKGIVTMVTRGGELPMIVAEALNVVDVWIRNNL